MKKCTKCGEEKELNEFNAVYDKRTAKTYISNICKQCNRDRCNNWIKKNPEKNRKYTKSHREKNRDRVNEVQRKNYYKNHESRIEKANMLNKKYCAEIKEKYGISRTTLYRNGGIKVIEELFKDRKCADCGASEDLNIHHDDNQGRHNKRLKLKPNNNINNLILLCRKCHSTLHMKQRLNGEQ